MKTIKKSLFFLNFSLSSKRQFLILLLLLNSLTHNIFPQNTNNIALSNDYNSLTDTTKPTQYRRGIGVQEGYQSYDEKYFGKNLSEEKRSLFPLQSTGVWTELNPKVPRVDYFGIQFVNKDTGWAVGNLGALIKSTDGGQSWTVIQTNTTKPILKVRSFNGQIVIASGFDGLILRSTNAGETFTQITSGVTGDMWGLQMLNDTLGWACGNVNSLIKTTDGGQSWQRIFTPGYTSDYWWLEFLNENYGFIAGNGYVLRTTNGGINWDIIPAGDSYPLFCLDVIDSLHIAAAGYGGTNYSAKNLYSSDGGNNWIVGDTLTTEAVNCIQYVNPDTGYLVMTNVSARKTTNRGQDWTGIVAGGEYEMQFFELANVGYSVGTGLRISKTENSFENWQRLVINDNFSDVFFINEEVGFAVSGVLSVFQGLYKTTNGGTHWEGVAGPSGQDILFLDSLTGFIGSNVIYKTTDGGTTWYIPNGGEGGADKISFINQTTGWAIRNNIIYKTTDRGENWITQFTAPSSITFYNIHFVDSLYGWTANLGGRPYKTTNSGVNWIQQTNLNIWESRDIYFIDSLHAFLINDIFNLLRTTDSGINWFNHLTSKYVIRVLGWLSTSHGFIVGDGVYETNDSGNTWFELLELRNVGLRKFYALNNYLGFSVGQVGLIFKLIDTSIVPVELISFEGKLEKNKTVLNWTTASEINNSGFQIEKSLDKKNWLNIGFVEGKGTTTEQNFYSFIDEFHQYQLCNIYYRLKQINYDGSFDYSKVIEINILIPGNFELYQNFPNPFNPSTNIKWQSPISGLQTLKVYDILGRELIVLLNEFREAGIYETEFDASLLSSGVYFYKITVGGYTQIKKMILTK